jgi:hypothetical protein
MATVEKRSWDRHETQRRIRHPLYALSGYIRRYVVLEGAAVALLYMAICFWVWLLLDYGAFAFLGLDGVKWLDRNYPAGTAMFMRAFVLTLVVLGLVAVVILKVVRRLFTEFSDASLALVLERRFPKQLGDRLITAVELADPRLAEKYGYSQEMVDYTIRSAAERVAAVPVTEVFNWGRLIRQWLLVAGVTVGVYILAFLICGGVLAFNEHPPTDFFWRFNRSAAVWGKRDLLLMNRVYWPTQAYVEFVRFQAAETKADGTEVMKVARDEKRPDIGVRAFQWVVYDSQVPESVRPLKFSDLSAKPWVNAADLDIDLPVDWPHWAMSLDDLDPSVPTARIPESWKGKTSGDIRADLKNDHVRKMLAEAGVLHKVEDWLNWKTWTIDQLQEQLETDINKVVRQKLRAEHPEALNKLEALIGEHLEKLAAAPASNWDIRKLTVPAKVLVTAVGKQTRTDSSIVKHTDLNQYYVSLGEYKENVNLTVRAEDFYTLPKEIVLVPPPQFSSLSVVVDEPAYKYYWLQGGDQDLLKSAKHRSTKALSLTGPISQVEVLEGTDVDVVAHIERQLKPGVTITGLAPGERKSKEGNVKVPTAVPTLSEDGKSFSFTIPNVRDTYEFEVRFVDLDNVKGSRHIIIRPTLDMPPEEVNPLKLAVQLRTSASIVQPVGEDGEATPSPLAGLKGFFITPDALLPFRGTMQDDFGLTKMEWVYDYEVAHFNLFSTGPALDPEREKKKLEHEARLKLFATGFHSLPLAPGQALTTYAQWGMASEMVEQHIEISAKASQPKALTEYSAVMPGFKSKLDQIDRLGVVPKDFTDKVAAKKLVGPPPVNILPKEYAVDFEPGFDVHDLLSATLKPKGVDQVQKHYRLRVWMKATDNNLNRPGLGKSKEPVVFLVISETELRALILMQENKIRTDLEKIRDKLEKEVRVTINDQLDKLKKGEDLDLALIRLRVDNDIRKHLDKANKVLSKSLAEYEMIQDELFYNRMPANYMNKVKNKIIQPLTEINNPKTGEMIRLLEATGQAYGDLEAAEELYKPGPDGKFPPIPAAERDKHAINLVKTQAEVDALVKKLNAVIDAIGGEIGKEQVIAELEAMIESQKRQEQELAMIKKKIEDDIINSVGGN